jgi:hypothetical protein
MSRLPIAAVAAVAALSTPVAAPAWAQAPQVRIGVLSCSVAGGTGFVFGSSKQLDCTLEGEGRRERYYGVINKFGVDLGATTSSTISWAVLASSDKIGPGALAGNYGGVSGEATVGVGAGANALLGGSDRSIALQPLSVSTQQGINLAVGVAALELRPRR